ncbi:hypothetical protein L7Q76_28100 [Pseudomonas aeruginosa]|nr:hypothetical protein [Pseudomonas aeruginosa]
MCGILGYVGTGFSVSRFAGALRLLAHRGPFGEGIAALPNGAIGMTRLPMSGAAAVPLPPQEGQRRVAYNGEVYQMARSACCSTACSAGYCRTACTPSPAGTRRPGN